MFERELYDINPKPDGGWTVSRPFNLWLQEFRGERIRHICENDTGVNALDEEPLFILHFVPHVSLTEGASVDIARLSKRTSGLSPLGVRGFNPRFNADGFVTYHPGSSDGRSSAYLQLFRNGVVETASTHLSRVRDGVIYIASRSFEDDLIASVSGCLGLAAAAELSPPYSIGISMARIKGAVMATGNFGFGSDAAEFIETDIVMAPPIVIGSESVEPSFALRSALDFFWQATGWQGSPHYDNNGNRKPE